MIHILVLEDDPKLNQLVCTYLSDCGFATKGCLNAKDAYDEMYNSLYDLIISEEGNGLGLGLALVLRILRTVGGEISVASKPGAGSTFTVKIPMRGVNQHG